MRLTLTMFGTLDGVVQAPGRRDEDRNGFEHGGWQVPYIEDKAFHVMLDWFTRADAFLLGRRVTDARGGSSRSTAAPAWRRR